MSAERVIRASLASDRAGDRLALTNGRIRPAFDGLGLGWTYDDAYSFALGAETFAKLTPELRGKVLGLMMAFAILAVEQERICVTADERGSDA